MISKLRWTLALAAGLAVQTSFAQQKTLSGVVSEGGLPLPGVTVVIKGTQEGTQTDLDGKYSLKVKPGDVLVYSFIGMNDKEYKVSTANNYNVSLESEDSMLEEVVVTAYGTQTKTSIAGSIAVVDSKQIRDVTTSDVTQGLVGKVAGVQIMNNSGSPGDNATIRFRGLGSISASAEPLLVVDGVPFNGALSAINNSDIETISFLKDASAAALYGNRGANGVIIITTKRGQSGKTTVSFDTKVGIASSKFQDYNKMTSPSKYYESYYGALRNTYMTAGNSFADASQMASQGLISESASKLGSGLGYNIYNVSDNQLIDPTTGKINPNAQLMYHELYDDYLFRDGLFTQNNLSFSGGSDTTTFSMSLGHEKNEGIVANNDYQKITGRLSVDSRINKTFKVGGSVNYSHVERENPMGGDYIRGNNSAYSNPFFWSAKIAPIYPVHAYDKEGNIMTDQSGNALYDDGSGSVTPYVRPFGQNSNPYASGTSDYRKFVSDQVFTSAYLDMKLAEGLTFKYVLSADLYSNVLRYTMNPVYGSGTGVNGRANQEDDKMFAVTNQQLLNYNKWFGQHSVDILLGHETMERKKDNLYVQRTNMLFPDSPYIDHAAVIRSANGGNETYSLEGYFAKLNYGYNNKYFLNASIRRDASSYFHPDNKWGTFFGVGGAWVVSSENFMKGITWIDQLKLKSSYGEQGNDNLLMMNPYQNQFSIKPSFDPDAPITIIGETRGNKDITWEVNKNFNAGFEASFLNGRIAVEAEYFVRKVDDMLFFVPTPIVTGFKQMPYNAGNMKNTGVEVNLSGDIVRTNDLKVSLNVNGTHYKNKITKLPADQKSIVAGQFIREEGGSIYEYYLKEYVGVNQENGNAQFIKIDEKTGERTITENWNDATLQRIDKSPIPTVYGGFGLNVEYKGFDLAANFAYQFGGYGYDTKYTSFFQLKPGQNLHNDFDKTWNPVTKQGSMPRVDVSDKASAYGGSTMALIKSDYLSLQNITLGYTFNKEVVNTLGLSKLRLYAMVDNAALWSKRKGYDPRLNLTGLSGTGYPLYTTFAFGANIQF
ncbi:TonB-dependent receptor [Myroides marinus]|uniref:SusC/RagA family TonB-linked outer membrane protein n=1 Tax=Myroides marinus TaxID=703342 RepID=UPI002578AC0A|nr:TonB-dependent receptor [Myroides marinus]MDM1346187.1 TonB-dependent receptor [Myroides marinus]MDM1349553.1 TonB-dependent receptor [Myroides marinus]MDM1356128.1 TonB-dependent receptor [Myroides marinus]MDM1356763.1 TonB-dependent receptor [Myroides marinus]MDM1361108.1 TonB-dependent receptor [Myroides marinus]